MWHLILIGRKRINSRSHHFHIILPHVLNQLNLINWKWFSEINVVIISHPHLFEHFQFSEYYKLKKIPMKNENNRNTNVGILKITKTKWIRKCLFEWQVRTIIIFITRAYHEYDTFHTIDSDTYIHAEFVLCSSHSRKPSIYFAICK